MFSKKTKLVQREYLGKYDFLRSLNRPKELWFLTDEEILQLLSTQTETDEDEVEEYDAVEYWKQNAAPFAKKGLVIENDAKIIEGKKIDLMAREFIFHHYQKMVPNEEIKVYDFDELIKPYVPLEKQFHYFQRLLKDVVKKQERAIFFQPTFLAQRLKLVTKPDAISNVSGKWELIEVKGTTTSRRYHLLDILFQNNVILRSGLNLSVANYYLCVVAYEKTKKNNVTFVLTETFLPSRAYSESAKVKKEKELLGKFHESVIQNIQKEKIGAVAKDPFYFHIFLQERNFNLLIDQEKYFKWEQYYYHNIYEQFDQIISTLHAQAKRERQPIKIKPSWQFNNFFKEFEYMPKLKAFLAKHNHPAFQYSGKVLCWTYAMIAEQYQINPETAIKQLADNKDCFSSLLDEAAKNHPEIYYGRTSFSKIGVFYSECLKRNQSVYMNFERAQKLMNSLKKRRVYFDFETISLAIRPIDNILPFSQVVTQCSILKAVDTRLEDQCLNLITDPQDIQLDFFKKVVDELYSGHDASYIVYNKSFEQTRLQEMIEYLQDPVYTKKINQIIQNIYDLADFLNLSKEMICIKELHGNYSIKKVLPLLLSDDEIVRATKVIDYNKLNVQKGDQCQNLTTQRFYNLIDDAAWVKVAKQLQIYCENDVRVMVALEQYVKKHLKNYHAKFRKS